MRQHGDRRPGDGRQWEWTIDGRAGLYLAVTLAFVALGWTGREFSRYWRGTAPPQPVELTLRALLPENGGWVGDGLQVAAGQPVRLTVEGVEGSHALAIGHTSITSSEIAPGQAQVVEFMAPTPGRYVLYCTRWCSPNHWRMRTVLEVVDPANPDATLAYAQETQRYSLPLAQMDLDAPHPAAVWPEERPGAGAGATVWERMWPDTSPAAAAAALGWPLASPSDVHQRISAAEGPVLSGAAGLSERERWNLAAYLWRAQSRPEALAQGAALFSQNCVSCHGETGAGDGFAAGFAPAPVPNFRDAATAAGASPALYYAKIARGGMGTGMPNWGTIFREDELWSLVDHLYTFLFDDH